ncbi:hypothetical protein [Pseudomonas putida]|uniref:hypothetical protein n=1 Tax=Pseudomonas putida TaxID=303 RepID=UPI00095399B7|nr:hypothetical protein [Pseudomonas putida]SIR73044.1 hypothetical protein SAMN05216501_1683 [Pseudomonas putida]
MNNLASVATLEGEVLSEAVLDARAMCSMNFARDEFNRLYELLYPMCSSHTEGPMCDIARHLEQVRIFSRNFCWAHRHLGASYGVVGERAGMDDEVIV